MKSYIQFALVTLLLSSMGLSSCKATRESRCPECPEFTEQPTPLLHKTSFNEELCVL